MELNEHVLAMLVREKLDDARATTARRALLQRARPPRRPWRARVGAALIALGERLAGVPTSPAGLPVATASRSHG
jgi:hypothetical protein